MWILSIRDTYSIEVTENITFTSHYILNVKNTFVKCILKCSFSPGIVTFDLISCRTVEKSLKKRGTLVSRYEATSTPSERWPFTPARPCCCLPLRTERSNCGTSTRQCTPKSKKHILTLHLFSKARHTNKAEKIHIVLPSYAKNVTIIVLVFLEVYSEISIHNRFLALSNMEASPFCFHRNAALDVEPIYTFRAHRWVRQVYN